MVCGPTWERTVSSFGFLPAWELAETQRCSCSWGRTCCWTWTILTSSYGDQVLIRSALLILDILGVLPRRSYPCANILNFFSSQWLKRMKCKELKEEKVFHIKKKFQHNELQFFTQIPLKLIEKKHRQRCLKRRGWGGRKLNLNESESGICTCCPF